MTELEIKALDKAFGNLARRVSKNEACIDYLSEMLNDSIAYSEYLKGFISSPNPILFGKNAKDFKEFQEEQKLKRKAKELEETNTDQGSTD